MKNKLIIILSCFYFLSCEKIENVEDYPFHKSVLVVNCLFKDSEMNKFSLSKSLSPLDNAPYRELTNSKAYIKIFENNVLWDSFGYKNGGYFSTKKPTSGKEYKIEAFHPGFDKVFSKEILPENFKIDSIKVTSIQKKKEYYTEMERTFEIDLDKQIPNNSFIILKIERAPFYDSLRRYIYSNEFFFNYESKDFVPDFEIINDEIFIKTNSLNLKSLKIKTNSSIYDYINPSQNKVEFKITILNCSENTFEYLKRTKLQSINFNDPFSEPTPVNNNIINGFGIFGTFTYTVEKIEVEK